MLLKFKPPVLTSMFDSQFAPVDSIFMTTIHAFVFGALRVVCWNTRRDGRGDAVVS